MRYAEFAELTSQQGTNVEIVEFDHLSFPELTLKILEIGENLLEVVVKVTEVFDTGARMSLGFPADNSEIAPNEKIKLQKLGEYKFFPYRITTAIETFKAYFSGSSVGGKGRIYFYQ